MVSGLARAAARRLRNRSARTGFESHGLESHARWRLRFRRERVSVGQPELFCATAQRLEPWLSRGPNQRSLARKSPRTKVSRAFSKLVAGAGFEPTIPRCGIMSLTSYAVIQSIGKILLLLFDVLTRFQAFGH